jgi:hypothetical protein
MQPAIRFIQQPRDQAELIRQINTMITSLNVALLNLDHTNIPVLNYIPLKTDAPLGSATPNDGYLRAVKVGGVTEVQYYNGAAWVSLSSKTYAAAQAATEAAQALADANSYTDGEIAALSVSSTGSHTHGGAVAADGTHTHTIS